MHATHDEPAQWSSPLHPSEPQHPIPNLAGRVTYDGPASALRADWVRRSADPTISIVMPARNEARNLEIVLPELPQVDQLVLVDGHSVDGTVAVAKRIRPDITLVQQTRNGKGNALACGFAAAKGDIIVTLDADGSANPAEIPAFVEALVSGADFAKGTRFHRHAGSADLTRLRRVGNAYLRGVANFAFRTRFSDLCYGYNALWRDIIPLLQLPPIDNVATPGNRVQWGDGFEIETLITCRVVTVGLAITEIPSRERSRIVGETQLRTFSDGARVLRTITTEWRRSMHELKATREGRRCLPPGLIGDTTLGEASLCGPETGLEAEGTP
ncbi:MAG TPA: glycosyltransferase family 2 protein [Pseudonocardiaceae bacterium]|nr:glycosyltransferase family 2 protein [Pseudonocardiaceae bacterium]